MEPSIRVATIKDLSEISRLNLELFKYEQQWQPGLNLEWTNSFDGQKYLKYRLSDSKSVVFVAEVDSKIVGYLSGGAIEQLKHRTEDSFAALDNIFIHPDFRNHSLGKEFTSAFLQWCKTQKFDVARVGVLSKNEGAHRFYKRFGFEDTLITMELKLGSTETQQPEPEAGAAGI